MKEKSAQSGPSEFVLIKDNETKRLNIGESLTLDVETFPDHEKITSFVVIPKEDHIKMKIYYHDAFFTPEWGNIIAKLGSQQKEFSTTFSSSILFHEHDKIGINGTDMHFTPDLSKLVGKNWTLEHRPEYLSLVR